MRRLKFALAAVAITLTLALGAFPAAAHAVPLLPNGFTAKVVAHSYQVITGHINATGYDIGIYIGPGVHNVKVNGATVSGANEEGILVQRASSIVIENSSIIGNGTVATKLTECKAIVLAGAKNCLVTLNIIKGNQHGGISVLDDGPNIIFAPKYVSTSPVAGTGNLIIANLIKDNPGDCGIVLSAKNPGGGVSYNVVSWNTVLGGWSGTPGSSIPYVGGIVVAGGAFGPVKLQANVVSYNVVTGGVIPGISLHAFGPAVISGTQLIGNKLTNNGTGELSKDTTGIEIFAVPSVGTISGTQVLADRVSNDYYGVWHANDTGTHIALLTTSGVTVPVFP